MQQAASNPRNRIDALTWLRGIAAFIVILFHVKRSVSVSYTEADEASNFLIMDFLDLGNFGVLMFFVISGATLYLNHRSFANRYDVYRFFLKRFFRIWPAFFISFCIFLLFIPIFEHFYLAEKQGFWIEVHAKSNYTITDMLVYLGLVFNLTGPPELFNIVYWSLPIEFQYYLLFPLLVLSIRWLSYFGPILVGGIAYLGFTLDLGRYIENEWTFLFAYTFCGGVLVGYIYSNFRNSISLSPLVSVMLITPLLIVLSLMESGFIQIPGILQRIPIINEALNWQGFSAILVVLIVLFTRFRSKRHDNSSLAYRLLMHYGEVSYSVYLYHMLFAAISVLIIINFGITSGLLKLLFTLVFTVLGSYLLASLSYRWVELWGIGYGRKFMHRLKH